MIMTRRGRGRVKMRRYKGEEREGGKIKANDGKEEEIEGRVYKEMERE